MYFDSRENRQPDHITTSLEEREKKMEDTFPFSFSLGQSSTAQAGDMFVPCLGWFKGQCSPGTHCSSAWEEESRHLWKELTRVTTSHIEGRRKTHVQTPWYHLYLPGKPHKHHHLQGHNKNKPVNKMPVQKLSPLNLGSELQGYHCWLTAFPPWSLGTQTD